MSHDPTCHCCGSKRVEVTLMGIRCRECGRSSSLPALSAAAAERGLQGADRDAFLRDVHVGSLSQPGEPDEATPVAKDDDYDLSKLGIFIGQIPPEEGTE